jgi:hypothetical protein
MIPTPPSPLFLWRNTIGKYNLRLRVLSSGMLRRVVSKKFIDVSEDHTASIFRVEE